MPLILKDINRYGRSGLNENDNYDEIVLQLQII